MMLSPAKLPAPTCQLPTGAAPALAVGTDASAGDCKPGVDTSVECIDDAGRFAAVRSEWNALLTASAAAQPFLTWEWLHAWWRHLGDGWSLRILAVRRGDELIAIAPLRAVHATLAWFSRLEFLGTGLAGSDHLDVIVRRGCDGDALAALAGYLQAHQVALRLNHLRPSSFAARLAEALAAGGWSAAAADDGTCPLISLRGHTFDSYLSTRGASHRANFRRRLRALGQQFDVRFDRVTTHRERCDMLAALVAFHERRWKAQGGSSAFMTPALVAFHDDATRLALDAGWLRMYVLRLDGRAAAVMYGLGDGRRFFFYQHGFDDAFSAYSVGLVLMGLTIRAAVEEGADEFDMLWGVEPYKFLWAPERRVLQRLELFPVHLGGTIQRRAVEAQRGVRVLARRVFGIGASLGS